MKFIKTLVFASEAQKENSNKGCLNWVPIVQIETHFLYIDVNMWFFGDNPLNFVKFKLAQAIGRKIIILTVGPQVCIFNGFWDPGLCVFLGRSP